MPLLSDKQQPGNAATPLFRPLAAGEAPMLAAAAAGIDPYRRLGFTAAALTAFLERDEAGLFRFAIESSGAAVGVLALRDPWLRGPLISMLAILPAAQGRGLGAAAMDWAAGWASGGERRSSSLWVTVSDFNQAARRFYARQGFTELASLPDLIRPGETELLLRRALAPPGR